MAEQLAMEGGTPVRDPSRPFPQWPERGQAEMDRVAAVVLGGNWGDIEGPEVAELARRFAKAHDVRYAIPVSSGTAALWLALKALGVGPGDEVIVPAFTFMATASVVCEVGAAPVFVDVTPDGLSLDPEEVERAITARTRAMIPVHMAGIPADLPALVRIAAAHHIPIIEDAAQAHGAAVNGVPVGGMGSIGCFSFQASKNLASGEGGMLTTNDPALYELLWSLHNCGRLPGKPWYYHYRLGENWRMTELQAALLIAQMERWPDQMARRTENADYLRAQLADVPGVGSLPLPGFVTRSAWHLMPFRALFSESSAQTAAMAAAIQAEGVPVSPGYPMPLYAQPAMQSHPHHVRSPQAGDVLPRTEALCRQLLWVPQGALLGTRADMDDIVRAVSKVFSHFRAQLG